MNPKAALRSRELRGISTIAVDAYDTIFSKTSLDQPGDIWAFLASRGYSVSVDDIWPIYRTLEKFDYRGRITGRTRWARILDHLGIKPDPRLIVDLNRCELDSYRRHTQIFPGALEFLAAATEAGIDVVLLTNATPNGWLVEQEMLLSEWTGTPYVSCLRHVVKTPYVDAGETNHNTLIGRLLLETAVNPQKVLVVDDQPNYLQVAHDLGCATALPLQGSVNPAPEKYKFVDLVVPDLLSIMSHLGL